MKRLAFTTILGTVLLMAAPLMAQIGDLSGTTPCCAKVCSGTTSTRCGDLIPGGLGMMLSGCAGIDGQLPATCVGGQLLDSGETALLDGCLCLLGNCLGPLAAGGGPLTPEQCTAASVAACESTGNVVVKQNDAACAPPTCNPACRPDQVCNGTTCACPSGETECSGTCVDTMTDEANCGGCGKACAENQTCQNGTCTSEPTCAGPEQPCANGHSDCCSGLQCVDQSAGDNSIKVCRHGKP
jgi:hypothetical protein